MSKNFIKCSFFLPQGHSPGSPAAPPTFSNPNPNNTSASQRWADRGPGFYSTHTPLCYKGTCVQLPVSPVFIASRSPVLDPRPSLDLYARCGGLKATPPFVVEKEMLARPSLTVCPSLM